MFLGLHFLDLNQIHMINIATIKFRYPNEISMCAEKMRRW